MKQKPATQKLLFVGHILFYNMIKPLPCSLPYFPRHFCLSGQNADGQDTPSHYTQIIRFGKEQSGWAGVILANLALMSFCLPISFTADWVLRATQLLSVKITVNAMLALIMLVKFDILPFHDGRTVLKFLYLVSNLIFSSYWTLACMFFAAFEN